MRYAFSFIGMVVLIFIAFIISMSLKPHTIVPTTVSPRFAQALIAGREFSLEVADTPELRTRGLSGHAELADQQGMLFLFDTPGNYAFWMRGMQFPIDIIWLRGDEIVSIAANAAPPAVGTPDTELERFTPDAPADRVIELRAGLARELGLAPRQQLQILVP